MERVPMFDDEYDKHETWPDNDSEYNTNEHGKSDSWAHHTDHASIVLTMSPMHSSLNEGI